MFQKDLISAVAALALAALLVPATSTAQESAPGAQAPSQDAPRTVEPDQGATEAAQQPAEAPVAHPVVAAVRERLGQTPRGADREDRQALAAFYAERSDPPVWVTEGTFSSAAKAAMAEIRKADDWGLSAAAFDLPRDLPADAAPAQQAEAEVKLGLAILKYARYARGGRLDPAQISRNIDQKASLRDPKTVIKEASEAAAPDAYLRSLHPKHVQFERLRQALLKSRTTPQAEHAPASTEEVRLPEGPSIRLGMQHPDVALLRKRLGVPARYGQEMLLDPELVQALKVFQEERGLVGSGTLTPRTRAALNGPARRAPTRTASAPEAQRILINMERWRWMPEDLGQFYVWDNIPEYMTRVVKNGREIHTARIVVGKVSTQTPIFSANMKYIVFHPEWGVPDSIKTNELLPYLRPNSGGGFWGGWGGTDTRILERHNLRVSYAGRPVDPAQIDWQRVDIRKFTFIQPGGAGNVLGQVKFRFPNKHDVYMHDTPQKDLFEKVTRTYSHGCIRVQNPRRLAEVLLEEDKGWSQAHVGNLFASGYNNEVTLNKQIPVHITYFTAMVGDDGALRTIPDVYGQDNRINAALAGRPLPPEPLNDSVEEPQPRDREARRTKQQPLPPMRPGKGGDYNYFSGLFGN